jgi:hypothetical protein
MPPQHGLSVSVTAAVFIIASIRERTQMGAWGEIDEVLFPDA